MTCRASSTRSQLTAKHRVATPVNWKQGEDVVIADSVSNEEAKKVFGDWK
jgi:alkyl hydroperoxide reductase subunit AhpC